MQNKIINEYFNWLSDLAYGEGVIRGSSFDKLLTHLHNTEFIFIHPNDQNRAEDGVNLRYRFALFGGYEDRTDYVLDILYGPCSVLEMIVALAVRCEENITDDPNIGDRTSQWVWGMIRNLGLGSMIDNRFDEKFVDDALNRFLNREYEPNGKGGLFTIDHNGRDLRNVEIWCQLCWYLDSIV